MNSVATRRFWDLFYALPIEVQTLAVKNNRCRLGDHYRVLGRLTADTMTWVWIGDRRRIPEPLSAPLEEHYQG